MKFNTQNAKIAAITEKTLIADFNSTKIREEPKNIDCTFSQKVPFTI